MAVGRSAVAATAMAINQDVKALFPVEGVSAAYLMKLLQFARPKAESRSVGSTVKGIRIQDYLNIEVPVADEGEQEMIVRVLDTCDAVIQKTEALIDNLKAIKHGLLHDLLTRGINANGQLRPPQAEAPHLYKQSPLGWIPNEWNCGALHAWLSGKPKNGYSPKEAGEWTGVQMLGLGCLSEEGFVPAQLKPAPRGDNRLMAATLQDGDLLMSRANTRDLVGLVGVYRDVGTPCSYPDLMMRLQPAPDTSAEFLQLVLQSPNMRQRVRASAVGTSESMVKISAKIVCELMTVMPPEPEQIRILNSLAACDSCLRAEREQGNALRAMKSALMGDLLTGRVRVTPLLKSSLA